MYFNSDDWSPVVYHVLYHIFLEVMIKTSLSKIIFSFDDSIFHIIDS
jgi:hypothetical protein